jgi:beta-lactamase class A
MGNTRYNSRIPRDLPPGVKVYHKTGTICGIVNDMGIIEVSKRSHAVVVVFINKIEETRGGEAAQIIAILARTVYDYLSGKTGN